MWRLVLCTLLGVFGLEVIADGFETIHTTANSPFNLSSYDFTNSNYVKFQVKACKKAYMQIGKVDPRPGGVLVPDFIVVLGIGDNANEGKENYLVTINHTPGEPSTAPTNHSVESLLDCDNFVQFYVKWRGDKGRLEFGTKDKVLLAVDDLYYQTRPVSPDIGVRTLDVDGEFRVFNPEVDASSCCFVAGNRYCTLPDMDCKLFTQKGPASTYLHRCAEGTEFDKSLCLCNHASSNSCTV